MSYDPNSARKGGSRKHLIEEVIKQIDMVDREKQGVIEAYVCIKKAVHRYQKEMAK